MKIDKKDLALWLLITGISVYISAKFFEYTNFLGEIDYTGYQLFVGDRVTVQKMLRIGYILGFFTAINFTFTCMFFLKIKGKLFDHNKIKK